MRRRILRIFLGLLAVLFVAVGTVQIILFTDLPRQWVITAVSRELGVDATAQSLRAYLWGKTTVAGLTVTLPIEKKPFVTASNVVISHRPVPLALLTGSLGCRSVRIDGPTVTIRRDETGIWSAQQFLSRLARLSGGSKEQAHVSLPELDIINGALNMVSQTGQSKSLGPVDAHGAPTSPAQWDFEVRVPPQVTISGKLLAGSDWTHEIQFDLKDINDLVGDWLPASPEPLDIGGMLYGNLRQGKFGGKLKLDHLQCGETQGRGLLGIAVSAAKSTVHIEELVFRNTAFAPEAFKVVGGLVQVDADLARADHILVQTGGLLSSVSGHWDWTARQAALNGSWTGAVTKPSIRHTGTWNGSVNWPRIGLKQVTASVTGSVNSPGGQWRGQIEVQGSGESWSTSGWHVLIPRFESRWKGADVTVEDIRAEVNADWPNLRLVHLSTTNAEYLKALGDFSARDRNWSISIEARGLNGNRGSGSPIDVRVIARGDPQDVTVKEFRIIGEGLAIESAGKVALPSLELSDAHAKASWQRASADANGHWGRISGRLQCEVALAGKLQPTNLDVQMQISSENMAFNKKAIGRLDLPCHARIGAGRAEFKAGPFQLFGGTLNADGTHDFSMESSQLALDAHRVMLQPVAELLDLPLKCQGVLDADLQVNLPLSDVNQVTASGSWDVRDINLPPIEADSAQGQIRIDQGVAIFDEIRLKQEQGMASASVSFRLDQPQRVSVDVRADQWPTTLPKCRIGLVTDGSGNIVLDLSKRAASGKANISTSVAIDQKKFGHVSAGMVADQRTVYLNDLRIDLLGGNASGTARVPLDDLVGSWIDLQWRDLETATLAEWWPKLEGLSGRSSGSLTARPTDSPRALGRLGLEVSADNTDCSFRGASIGGCRISAHLGKETVLIDQSQFELMEGIVSTSGNVRLSPGKESAYLRADFSQLNLDQLTHLFLPRAKPVKGRLGGNGVLVVLSDWGGLTGLADMRLTESDLAQTTVINTIYNTLNLKIADSSPTGQGQITMRFEGSSIDVPGFVYFNRGTEIRGAGAVEDLSKGKASPVRGYAIGSARPLRDVSLPGIEDLDRLMASLQTGVSSIHIQGTLAEPRVEPVPFRNVGHALRALLWHQLRE